MTAPLDSLITFGVDILGTSVDPTTKTILATIGNAKTGAVFETNVRVCIGGVFSRPSPPSNGIAAQATVIRCSSGSIIVGYKDSRTQTAYGALADGEFAIVAGGADGKGQARILGKADGSVHIYSRKGNDPSGPGLVVQLDAASDAIRLLNSKGNGIIIDDDGVSIVVGGAKASITVKASGDIDIIGTEQTMVEGKTIVLGDPGGVPPVMPVQSVLVGATGLAGKPSVKVMVPK